MCLSQTPIARSALVITSSFSRSAGPSPKRWMVTSAGSRAHPAADARCRRFPSADCRRHRAQRHFAPGRHHSECTGVCARSRRLDRGRATRTACRRAGGAAEVRVTRSDARTLATRAACGSCDAGARKQAQKRFNRPEGRSGRAAREFCSRSFELRCATCALCSAPRAMQAIAGPTGTEAKRAAFVIVGAGRGVSSPSAEDGVLSAQARDSASGSAV